VRHFTYPWDVSREDLFSGVGYEPKALTGIDCLPSLAFFFLAVNRLDRLTSGLMIIALSVKKAREFELMMQKCEIKKEYVCKVSGQFPRYGIIAPFLSNLYFVHLFTILSHLSCNLAGLRNAMNQFMLHLSN
jgi:hypothetical protein